MYIFIIILIISVILHELAHGYTAYSLGDPTAKNLGRLSANPLKHIDPIGSLLIPFLLIISGSSLLFGWAKPVPYNPYNLKGRYAEFFVASAGVFLNIVVAVSFGLFYRFFGEFFVPSVGVIIFSIVSLNLFLAVFNMLPIPPLDGYRMFVSAVPYNIKLKFEKKVEEVNNRIGYFGMFIGIFILLYFLITPLAGGVFWITEALSGISLY